MEINSKPTPPSSNKPSSSRRTTRKNIKPKTSEEPHAYYDPTPTPPKENGPSPPKENGPSPPEKNFVNFVNFRPSYHLPHLKDLPKINPPKNYGGKTTRKIPNRTKKFNRSNFKRPMKYLSSKKRRHPKRKNKTSKKCKNKNR